MKKLLTLLLILLPLTSFGACITDDTEMEICLDSPPERAISLYGAFSELIWEMKAGETIVARTKNDTTIPEMADLGVVGSGLRPNIEYLMAMRPDLVISRGSKAASNTLTAMRQRDIRVAAFDPESVSDIYSVIERLGVLYGKEREARELADRIRERIAKVTEKTGTVKERPTLIYEVRSEPLTVAGSGGLVAELVEIAGGRIPVEVEKKLVRYDVEALLAIDPDGYVIQEGPMNKNPLPPAERPHHANLRAVKEGRVMVVDEKLIARPGPRVGEAIEKLSRFLHPGLW